MYNIVVFQPHDKLLASYVEAQLKQGFVFIKEESDVWRGGVLYKNSIYHFEDRKILPAYTFKHESMYRAAQTFLSWRTDRNIYMHPIMPDFLEGVLL